MLMWYISANRDEDVFAAAGLSLVPLSLDEVAMDCSCERWPMPCVHLAATCYAVLSLRYLPLLLPARLQSDAAALFTLGRWLGFALVATLLVVFITRITRTLRATDAHEAALGRPLETAMTAGYLDTRVHALYDRVPALCYGAISRNIHGVDECVSLSSVQRTTAAMALFVAEWCGLEDVR